jgi:hypothetical protein
MVNNYETHVELMTRNLKDLGLSTKNISEKTKKTITTDQHPVAYAGKMFEDDWED